MAAQVLFVDLRTQAVTTCEFGLDRDCQNGCTMALGRHSGALCTAPKNSRSRLVLMDARPGSEGR